MMNRSTGRRIGPIEHLQQSVGDILTTPIGSRAMRRDYGSLAFDLLDQPDNELTRTKLIASGAAALMRWEPRLQAVRLRIERSKPGKATITVEGSMLSEYARKARPVQLRVNIARGGNG